MNYGTPLIVLAVSVLAAVVLVVLLVPLKKRCPRCGRRWAVRSDGEWAGLAMSHCEKCGATFDEEC